MGYFRTLGFRAFCARPALTSVGLLAVAGACSNGSQGTTGGGAGQGNSGGLPGVAGGNGMSGGIAGASGGNGAAAAGGSSLPSGGFAGGNVGGAAGTAGNNAGASGTAAGGSGGSGGVGGAGAGDGGTGGAPVACQAPIAVIGTPLAVTVDVASVGVTVPAGLMGIHASAYDNNLRAATTPALLKAAGVRSIRYPGGSYADVYHWSTHTAIIQAKGTANEGVPYLAEKTDFGNFIGLLDDVGASAMITVNYGSNPQGTGPGVPQEAAAWVAYANGSPTDSKQIGLDGTGTDWKTVGYWAGLRVASKLAVDDGQNFLRIARTAPVGIKHWEVGNELYGNGYYYGGEGWEEDLHLLHGTARSGNANLSPVKYGQVFPTFAQAMKAVDPTISVGAILHWPYTEYASPNATDWNDSVLNSNTCAAIDFGVNHWYAGSSFTDLLTRPHLDIPQMYKDLQAKVKARCPAKTATLPIAVTEWGPNYLNFKLEPPAKTQLIGLFAADAYANFMEQGAINVDWLEIHNQSYLGETGTDTPVWGYHGQQIASYLANGGDSLLKASLTNPPSEFAGGLFQVHASRHADGALSVMLLNISAAAVAAATVNFTGLSGGTQLPCVGTVYTYAPSSTDVDGAVSSKPIFSSNDGNSRVSVNVPAYSAVVVVFPKS